MAKTLSYLKFFLFLFIVISSYGITIVSSLPEPKPGVKVGEWIEYKNTWEWYQSTKEAYEVKFRREVLEVNDTRLKINVTTWYSNGSVISKIGEGDVVAGTGYCAMIFIPANLTKGDTIDIQNFENNVMIEGETKREYLGVQRIVIYSNFTAKGYDITIFWDKIKGVALEINWKRFQYSVFGGKNYLWACSTVVWKTNMFSLSSKSGEQPYWPLVSAAVLITLVISSLLIWRRNIKQKRLRKRRRRLRSR